jgi:hypothetical protein
MRWTGPDKDEIWRQLSEVLGAEFVESGFCRQSKVRVEHGSWTITLDTYTVSSGHAHQVYTRIRAPFVNPEGFRFVIYRKGYFSDLGKFLGMQDIEVGNPDFDDAFIVQGNDEAKVVSLFTDRDLQARFSAQPKIRLEVKDSEGWFGPRFPAEVDELYFLASGVIKDIDRLKSLFDLFAAVLDRLCSIGGACQQTPDIVL